MSLDQIKDLIEFNINANMKDGDHLLIVYLIENTYVLRK